MSEPTSITREALDERVRSEVAHLGADDLAWWSEHRIDPFVVTRMGYSQYAVATTDGPALIYFERHDQFGQYYREERWEGGIQLFKDLADAIRHLTARELMSRTLAETAASLLRLGFLERGGYSDLRWRALEVLARLGPDAAVAVPRLVEILGGGSLDCGLRERAVATLAAVGPKAAPAVPKLIEMAADNTEYARAWCLKALGKIGPAASSAVPLLIDFLLNRERIDPSPSDVFMSAVALGNIGAIEALPALLQVLRETDDPDVAREVAEALGKIGAIEALPALLQVLRETDDQDGLPVADGQKTTLR